MLSKSKTAEVCFVFKYEDIFNDLIVICKELHTYWHNYMRLINSDRHRKKPHTLKQVAERSSFSAFFHGKSRDILVHSRRFRVF